MRQSLKQVVMAAASSYQMLMPTEGSSSTSSVHQRGLGYMMMGHLACSKGTSLLYPTARIKGGPARQASEKSMSSHLSELGNLA